LTGIDHVLPEMIQAGGIKFYSEFDTFIHFVGKDEIKTVTDTTL
jgi:hypothetical protein